MTRLLRTALGNRGIARLEAGWAFMSLGQWTFSIALALYAYYEEGAGGVAAAVAVRMLPAALLVLVSPAAGATTGHCGSIGPEGADTGLYKITAQQMRKKGRYEYRTACRHGHLRIAWTQFTA